MPKLSSLFVPHVAKSHAYGSYDTGTTAFVSNGFSENGVAGYVEAKKGDKVFKDRALCVSAFCEATVQEPPFVARGNGGSGLVVLVPKAPLARLALLQMAAYINEAIRWRFSYGRMVTPDRLMNFDIPEPTLSDLEDVEHIVPQPILSELSRAEDVTASFQPTVLTDLFTLRSGDYHKAESLADGPYPLISCGNKDNGLVRFVEVPPQHLYENCLTVAYNGSWPMLTKYHPYRFAAKDDVAVLIPKQSLRGTTVLFIQMMLSRETWRYSYGRKCFREKLMRTVLHLPMKDGKLDEDAMQAIMNATAYWHFLGPQIKDMNPGEQPVSRNEVGLS